MIPRKKTRKEVRRAYVIIYDDTNVYLGVKNLLYHPLNLLQ